MVFQSVNPEGSRSWLGEEEDMEFVFNRGHDSGAIQAVRIATEKRHGASRPWSGLHGQLPGGSGICAVG